MAKKTRLFRQKERKTRAEVSEFIQQLGEKIGEGEIVLLQTPEDLELAIPQHMSLKVKVTKKTKPTKGTKHKLTLKLTWYDSEQDEDQLALG